MNKTTIDLPPTLMEYLNQSRGTLPPVSDPDQPLQIDSLGLIRLVAFLESELHIKIEDDELLADHFVTLRALADLIQPKLRQTKSAATVHESEENAAKLS